MKRPVFSYLKWSLPSSATLPTRSLCFLPRDHRTSHVFYHLDFELGHHSSCFTKRDSKLLIFQRLILVKGTALEEKSCRKSLTCILSRNGSFSGGET